MRNTLSDLINTALSDQDSAMKVASARGAESRGVSGSELTDELLFGMPKLSADDCDDGYRPGKKDEKDAKKDEKEKKSSLEIMDSAQYAMKLAEALDVGARFLEKMAAEGQPVVSAAPISGPPVPPSTSKSPKESFTGSPTDSSSLPTNMNEHTGKLDGERPANNTGKTASFTRDKEAADRVLRAKQAQAEVLRRLGGEKVAAVPAAALGSLIGTGAGMAGSPIGSLTGATIGGGIEGHRHGETVQGAVRGDLGAFGGGVSSGVATALLAKGLGVSHQDAVRLGEIVSHAGAAGGAHLATRKYRTPKEEAAQTAEAQPADAQPKVAQDPSSPQPVMPAHGEPTSPSTEPGPSQFIGSNESLINMTKAQAKDRSLSTVSQFFGETPKRDNAVAANKLPTDGQKLSHDSMVASIITKFAENQGKTAPTS